MLRHNQFHSSCDYYLSCAQETACTFLCMCNILFETFANLLIYFYYHVEWRTADCWKLVTFTGIGEICHYLQGWGSMLSFTFSNEMTLKKDKLCFFSFIVFLKMYSNFGWRMKIMCKLISMGLRVSLLDWFMLCV